VQVNWRRPPTNSLLIIAKGDNNRERFVNVDGIFTSFNQSKPTMFLSAACDTWDYALGIAFLSVASSSSSSHAAPPAAPGQSCVLCDFWASVRPSAEQTLLETTKKDRERQRERERGRRSIVAVEPNVAMDESGWFLVGLVTVLSAS
jgi:hypothetical protein